MQTHTTEQLINNEVSRNQSMSPGLSLKLQHYHLIEVAFYGNVTIVTYQRVVHSLSFTVSVILTLHRICVHALPFCRYCHSISDHDICILYLTNNICHLIIYN